MDLNYVNNVLLQYSVILGLTFTQCEQFKSFICDADSSEAQTSSIWINKRENNTVSY